MNDAQRGGWKFSRQQREAEHFRRFLDEYRDNGGNAYRAALVAGYSKSTARAKSYRMGQLAEAHKRLERLGLTASVSNPLAPSSQNPQNSGETAASTSTVSPNSYRESFEIQPSSLLSDRGPYNCLPRIVEGSVRFRKKRKR